MYVARAFVLANSGGGFAWLEVHPVWEVFPWGSLAPLVHRGGHPWPRHRVFPS